MQCYAAGRHRQEGRAETASAERAQAAAGSAWLGGRDSPVLPQPARAGNVARRAAPPVHFAIDQTRPPALPACLHVFSAYNITFPTQHSLLFVFLPVYIRVVIFLTSKRSINTSGNLIFYTVV